MLMLVLLILGVLAIGAYGFSVRARALAASFIHLGWVGLFLISLTWLYAAWPKS